MTKIRIACRSIGMMDGNGVCFIRLREKRMIKPSGQRLYPFQDEERLSIDSAVPKVCAIGVPSEKQVERIKRFVVWRDPDETGTAVGKERIDFVREAGTLTLTTVRFFTRKVKPLHAG
jgi:acyl-coenzyme A synthetase/AMP-(fatty) acid ligase